jgi:hypothetical protein
VSGILGGRGWVQILRRAFVRIELLLNYSLRSRLLACRLMFGLKLEPAAFADSDDWNVLDSLDDPEIALGHKESFPQFVCVRSHSAAFANRFCVKFGSRV